MNCAFSVLADVLLRACRLQRGRLHVKCGRGRWHVKCGIMAAHRTDTPCAAAAAASALSGGCLTQALHGTITVAVAPGGGVHLNVNGLETDAKLKDALMPGRDTTNNTAEVAWSQHGYSSARRRAITFFSSLFCSTTPALAGVLCNRTAAARPAASCVMPGNSLGCCCCCRRSGTAAPAPHHQIFGSAPATSGGPSMRHSVLVTSRIQTPSSTSKGGAP